MNLKNFLINLLFPIICRGCNREGEWLCSDCFKKLKFPGPLVNLETPYLDKLYLAGDYQDELLASLIKNFKFKSLPAIGEYLGRFLALFWQGPAWTLAAEKDNIIVIPIPLSKKRERQRGFNQAEILAKILSTDFDYHLNLNLRRKGHQRPQSSLSEKRRALNVREAFYWQGEELFNQIVILVDDVVTTGATLNEAARIIKSIGAKKVYGLALAKG